MAARSNHIQNRSAFPDSVEPPHLVLDERFTDAEEWASANVWDACFRQLTAGPLSARVQILAGPGCMAMKAEISQSLHQSGRRRPGYLTFGLPHATSGEFRWCGSPGIGGEILNFNQESGFDGTTSRGFSGCTLSFRSKMLEELAEIMGLPFDPGDFALRPGVLRTRGSETAALQRRMAAAFASMSMGQDPDEELGALFHTEAAASILRLLYGPASKRSGVGAIVRRSALNKALEILATPEHLPITVAELCRRVDASAPTLYRAFQEEFGVGTKEYIQSRVLAGVRADLIAAAPGTQVNDIANSWGLWHMGRFAADYRRQFGELPSETLRH
jgi:AraC family ethanolamine operon transcriptional activator